MEDKPSNKTFSFRQRLRSFRYAFRGIGIVIKTQHNFWIHLSIAILVIVAGFIFHINTTEWILVVFAIGLVLAAETFNSAIEELTDLASPGFHSTAGKVKDLAAGAVLIAAITAALVGLLIFVPKILNLL